MPLHTYTAGVDRTDTDVILILSASSAIKFAKDHFVHDLMVGPDPAKIARFSAFLAEVPQREVEMPVIFYKVFPFVFFETGRHRATVLGGMNQTVPVLTSEKIANALSDHWGSKTIALTEYDFSACKLTKFVSAP
ncbi:hypothetical protein AABC73_01770 [Pseudomonas sp. G.S.17]|uniref:hypothetical protein n=1 Tax=Pseudomonas sp. G.S.17 TaxID=3137451 RepID=UPI00311C8A25